MTKRHHRPYNPNQQKTSYKTIQSTYTTLHDRQLIDKYLFLGIANRTYPFYICK